MSLSVQDLGVLFDSKLLFSDHCNSIVNKAYIRANMLFRYLTDEIIYYINVKALFDLHILSRILVPLDVCKNFSPRGKND